jgi:hypothetical protein
MEDKNWLSFIQTGSVFDYLNYKENEKAKNNDDCNQGISNQRTDNRGE